MIFSTLKMPIGVIMKKEIVIRFLILVSLFVVAINTATATVIDPNGVLVDMGSFTIDTKSNRLWLDLGQSAGTSYDTMKNTYHCDPQCTSGPFTNWTFAQAGDLKGLIEDTGLAYPSDPPTDDQGFYAYLDKLKLIIEMMGADLDFDNTACLNGCGALNGILNRVLTDSADLAGGPYYGQGFDGFVQQAVVLHISCCGDWAVGDVLNLDAGGSVQIYASPVSPDAGSVAHDSSFTGGVWLYHQVPEPGILLLFATGFIQIFLISRRAK
jgi:hypothetical protein